MPVTPDKPGPYAPASAILSIIDRHRNKGLPHTVDAEVLMRSGISDSLVPRTLQSLVTLDLIDQEGKISEVMEGLRLSPEGEFTARMGDWVRAAYADALMFIEPDAEESAIRDTFRSFNPIGQQPRMVALFTGLMIEAGLREKSDKKPMQKRSTSGRATTWVRSTKKLLTQTDGEGVSGLTIQRLGLDPAIAGILQSLPSKEEGWTQDKRNQFLTTFGAVIDFCIPVRQAGNAEDKKINEEENYD